MDRPFACHLSQRWALRGAQAHEIASVSASVVVALPKTWLKSQPLHACCDEERIRMKI